LGFGGTFEINDELFVVTPGMTLEDVRDLFNSNSKIEVYAYIDPDFRLNLTSLNSTRPIKMQDISGSVLEDLGLLPMGAFNLAQTGPTLPLTDSRGAIHTNVAAPLAFPLNLTTANQDLVVALSGAANDGYSQTEVLKLDAITYNTSAELVAEIQRKADLAFGEEKLLVNDLGGGVIEIETFVQSGAVTVSDLQIGGTAPDGTVDTASALLGFNAVASVQEVADTAGVDGNDRFTIDLGLSAYRVTGDEEPLDLPPIEINIDATVALTVADLVDEINEEILKNRYLSGLVEAVDQGGRVRLQTTKEDGSVTANDLLLANAVLGPVVPATDTLGALGFYVDPLTGISAPPVPATVFGTAPFPPGIGAIVAGVNDQFTIDLGPGSSPDGTDQGPVTITLTPGAYPTAAALAAEINYQISLSPKLKNAVLAQVRVVGPLSFVDLVTTNVGSRVQASDLILADGPLTPGTLANLGLAGPTVPGGGSADGQGIIVEPHNLIDTVLQIRDELFGYAAPASRLVDLTDGADGSLGLFPGHTIRITSDGSFNEFTVQRFTTLDDLADAIEQKLGFALEVDVLRDGRLHIFNPTTTVVNDIAIEAFDENGAPVAAFDQAFAPVSGKLFYRSELLSETMYEDERFQRLTYRIGDVDDAFETILSVLAQTGSRHKRLELTLTQNDAVEVNLIELQSKNENVDIAETVIHLQEQENVLRAALGAGASVLPPSLFDFLF
jgi:flagellin-like hook-associated protein FlgL